MNSWTMYLFKLIQSTHVQDQIQMFNSLLYNIIPLQCIIISIIYFATYAFWVAKKVFCICVISVSFYGYEMLWNMDISISLS